MNSVGPTVYDPVSSKIPKSAVSSSVTFIIKASPAVPVSDKHKLSHSVFVSNSLVLLKSSPSNVKTE